MQKSIDELETRTDVSCFAFSSLLRQSKIAKDRLIMQFSGVQFLSSYFLCGRKLRKYATCFRRNQEVCQRCTLGGKSTGHRYVWSNYTASERIFPLSRLNCSVSFCTRTPPLELTAACTGGATRFCDATWGFRTLPRRPLLFPPFVCRVELWILILQYVHDIVHMITIIRRHH